jgi:flagellar brake protein
MSNQQYYTPSRSLKKPPEYGEYAISGMISVCGALSSLVEAKQVISLWQEEKKFAFFSSLMAFDPSKALIYFDRGPEGLKRKTHLAEDFFCHAVIDSQPMQFTLHELLQDSYYGSPAWVANLPTIIKSLSQRENPRVPVTTSTPSFCKISGIEGYACPSSIRVQLIDIGSGGFGFVAPLIMCGIFAPNSTFTQCELQIFEEAPIMVNLKIRTSFGVTSRSGIRAVRVVAEITNIAYKPS